MSNTVEVPAIGNWQPIDRGGPFTQFVGPMFSSNVGLGADEPARLGFRVLPHHCNPRQVCHGGMMATFLDIVLARGARIALDIHGSTPTISLSIDYLSPAHLGDWVESRLQVLHHTTRTVFVQAVLHGPDAPVLRGSGIFRLPST